MSLHNLLFGGLRVQEALSNWGLTILRVLSGLGLSLTHGIFKIPPSEKFIAGVGELGFPAAGFFAWAAGISEFFGGLLLAIGLLVRPSAFFIMVTMLVAAFLRHAADPFAVKEKALLYALIALAFLMIGSGRYGVDSLIQRRRERRNEQ